MINCRDITLSYRYFTIASYRPQPLISIQALKQKLPLSTPASQQVSKTKKEIVACLTGQSQKMLVVCGPCSIHDPHSALDYAKRLATVAKAYKDQLIIIMRCYFEKPRSISGWRGLVMDPKLDGSYAINEGLAQARALLLQINELGLSCATEFLSPIIAPYYQDLISWGAIGARTVSSQVHRALAAQLPMPIGLKNDTHGNIDLAIQACLATQQAQAQLGINDKGNPILMPPKKNPFTHIILRGAKDHTNYSYQHIQSSSALLESFELRPNIMIDCSHGNSEKDSNRQAQVARDICNIQRTHQYRLFGIMLESHLVAGKQEPCSTRKLTYGQSITDDCMNWPSTEKILHALYQTRGYLLGIKNSKS